MKDVLITLFRRAVISALFVAIAPTVCLAGNSMQEAIADYNKGHYYPALKKLTALESAQPENAMVHYYSGLCKQAVGQIAEARSEYQWVYGHDNGHLKKLAQAGWSRLGSYSAHTGGSQTTTPTTVLAGTAGAAVAPGPTAQTSRLKKVIEFYSTTCPTCIEFAPTFDQTKSQFSDVEFQQLDISDPSNSDLVARYRVRNYPTLVYLDGTGNVLMNRAGAPIGVAAFASSLRRFHQ